nr:DUF2207 domain-containing protein [Atopococcus tabaci]
MNKPIKKAWLWGLGLLFSLAVGETVFAENQLQSMEIEVELQEDGSGVVTENRQMRMDDGTELYIVLDELQDSQLLDFSVSGFEEVEEWDSDASQEEKAGKYGVIETGSGLELVWGIGEYGDNAYEVTYTLSNLVRELNDGQALLWNFDTFSDIPAENLTLDITGPEPFTEDNIRFWGFGFDGDIQLRNGRVVWEAFEEVDNNNDVTVLLQFPPGLFNTQASVDMTLEEQREMAMDGSAYNDEQTSDTVPILIISGVALAGLGAGGTALVYSSKLKKAKEEAGAMRTGNARMKANEGRIYDGIPFTGKDLAGIAYFLQEIDKGYFEDYFSAYLLKWVEEGRIRIETTGEDPRSDEDYETTIELFDYEEERRKYSRSFKEYTEDIQMYEEDTYENGLWLMLLEAADRTGFLTDDRMRRWAKKHAKEVEAYAGYLVDYSKDYLEKNGYLSFREITVWGTHHEVAVAAPKGEELFDRLVQFDNYLEEVELAGFQNETSRLSFEELLLWSVLFYRREEITDQFEDMMSAPSSMYYPEDQFIYYYWYWYGMSGFRENWTNGLASGGFYTHDTSGSSGAAGMGGSTSFGGGFGAGGGGGGGAR